MCSMNIVSTMKLEYNKREICFPVQSFDQLRIIQSDSKYIERNAQNYRS